MHQLKKKIEDTLLKFLLKKDFNEIQIIEIRKKARIPSKKFFKVFKTKEEIMISFFKRIDLALEVKIKKKNLEIISKIIYLKYVWQSLICFILIKKIYIIFIYLLKQNQIYF